NDGCSADHDGHGARRNPHWREVVSDTPDEPALPGTFPMDTVSVDRPARRGLTLLLFTDSYPYDVASEETFLGPQLPHLREAFERILVIPSRRGGRRAHILDSVEVDEGLAELLDRKPRVSLAARAS